MRQNQRSDDQHQTRPYTAALPRHFDIQPRNRHSDSVLRHRNPSRPKHEARRHRRLLLQKFHDPSQNKVRYRNDQQEKAKRKQKPPKSSNSKTQHNAAGPPRYQPEHGKRKSNVFASRDYPPSRVTIRKQRHQQESRTRAVARPLVGSKRDRLPIRVDMPIQINHRSAERKN